MENKIKTEDFREKVDLMFREASNLKCYIRMNSSDDDVMIEMSEDFAEKVDKFLILMENDFPDYRDYRSWYNRSYEENEVYKSVILFKNEELPGDNSTVDQIMAYYNYIVGHLILINHFLMSIEFTELYEQCTIKEEV